MSKALEENGGVTQQQQQTPPECTCGSAHRSKSERHSTAATSTSRRTSLDNQKGGREQVTDWASGVSSSRPASASASSPSLQGVRVSKESRRSGDVKPPAASSATPSLQGVRVSRESGKGGDVKQSPVNASPLQGGERKLRDRAKSGDVQATKSSLGNGSPSFREARSLRESRRSGEEQLQAKSSSGDAQPSYHWETSLRDSRRSGDVQQLLKSPSGNGSPSFSYHGEKSCRERRRSGDLVPSRSVSGSGSSSCQGEGHLRGSGTFDGLKAGAPSFETSPSFQEWKRDDRRSGNVHQAESPSVDGQAESPSIPEKKSSRGNKLHGDVQLLDSHSANGTPFLQGEERDCKESKKGDDEEQQPKATPGDASPPYEKVRSLRESLRGVDVPLFKSPSSSQASPVTPSSYFHKWGSFGESLRTGSAVGNSALALSSSGVPPPAPPSACLSLRAKLVAGQKLYGAFLVSLSTVVAEILGWAGYDFVVVDFDQLFPGDLFAALPVLQALASTGTPAIFRLPGDDPVLVNKALDMGPAGLMFSMIENEEAATNAVACCRYPPRGTRRGSRHMISRASRYGLDPSYMDRCEEDLLVICQLETTESLDHVMDIAGVEGVDCIQMGGLDCGASVGDPYVDYDKEKILERQRKVLLAGIATPENAPDLLFKRGYRLVTGAIDVVLLRNAALADLQRNKPSFNTLHR